MNQSISDGGDCRTAPATPRLLITFFVCRPKGFSTNIVVNNYVSVDDLSKYVYKTKNKVYHGVTCVTCRVCITISD